MSFYKFLSTHKQQTGLFASIFEYVPLLMQQIQWYKTCTSKLIHTENRKKTVTYRKAKVCCGLFSGLYKEIQPEVKELLINGWFFIRRRSHATYHLNVPQRGLQIPVENKYITPQFISGQFSSPVYHLNRSNLTFLSFCYTLFSFVKFTSQSTMVLDESLKSSRQKQDM